MINLFISIFDSDSILVIEFESLQMNQQICTFQILNYYLPYKYYSLYL